MVSTVQDVTARVKSEEARKESEALYRLLAEQRLRPDLDSRPRGTSSSGREPLGRATPRLHAGGDCRTGVDFSAIFTSDSAQRAVRALIDRMESFKQGRQDADRYADYLELTRRDGSTVWVEFVARYVVNENSGHVEAYGVSRDITERRQAEAERQRLWAELSQAQKMESIGPARGRYRPRLQQHPCRHQRPGGAGHTASSSAEGGLRRAADRRGTRRHVDRELLVFSRRSAIDMRLLDLNEVAGNLVEMLSRLLGENIGLQFDCGPCRQGSSAGGRRHARAGHHEPGCERARCDV